MATKKRSRVVLSQGTLAAKIFEKWARPGVQMPVEHLEAELPDVGRYDLVAALRALEKVGAGELLVVGKGHRSRFVWGDKAALTAAKPQQTAGELEVQPAKPKQATAKAGTPPSTRKAAGSEVSSPVGAQRPTTGANNMLEHAFHVRPGVLATFRLPADLTHQEVERLCQLLQSIPFV